MNPYTNRDLLIPELVVGIALPANKFINAKTQKVRKRIRAHIPSVVHNAKIPGNIALRINHRDRHHRERRIDFCIFALSKKKQDIGLPAASLNDDGLTG